MAVFTPCAVIVSVVHIASCVMSMRAPATGVAVTVYVLASAPAIVSAYMFGISAPPKKAGA